MSLFRIVKYSSLLFFLGKYKTKVFRVVAVLLFALMTSLLYQDVADYLQLQHPETVIYALAAKIVIVYGALLFVLLQFRPDAENKPSSLDAELAERHDTPTTGQAAVRSKLEDIENVEKNSALRNKYDKIIKGGDE